MMRRASSLRTSSRRTPAVRRRRPPQARSRPRLRQRLRGGPALCGPPPLAHYTRRLVGLRVCLVTPFAWSRPHDVNEHVDGLARELRALGHEVTVLAPSTRAADLVNGRRALLDGVAAEVIALGPALPV